MRQCLLETVKPEGVSLKSYKRQLTMSKQKQNETFNQKKRYFLSVRADLVRQYRQTKTAESWLLNINRRLTMKRVALIVEVNFVSLLWTRFRNLKLSRALAKKRLILSLKFRLALKRSIRRKGARGTDFRSKNLMRDQFTLFVVTSSRLIFMRARSVCH